MSTATEIRSYSTGKFFTILDEYVFEVSLESGCDDEVSSEYDGNWYGMMRNGHTIFRNHDPLLVTLNDAERNKLDASEGVIIRETSDGFVYIDYLHGQLDAEWDSVLKLAHHSSDQWE